MISQLTSFWVSRCEVSIIVTLLWFTSFLLGVNVGKHEVSVMGYVNLPTRMNHRRCHEVCVIVIGSYRHTWGPRTSGTIKITTWNLYLLGWLVSLGVTDEMSTIDDIGQSCLVEISNTIQVFGRQQCVVESFFVFLSQYYGRQVYWPFVAMNFSHCWVSYPAFICHESEPSLTILKIHLSS